MPQTKRSTSKLRLLSLKSMSTNSNRTLVGPRHCKQLVHQRHWWRQNGRRQRLGRNLVVRQTQSRLSIGVGVGDIVVEVLVDSANPDQDRWRVVGAAVEHFARVHVDDQALWKEIKVYWVFFWGEN